MKKIVLLAFILMAFMAVSCDNFSLFEKDILEVDKDSLTFRATEQRLSFHITTNGAWRIVENPQPERMFYTISPDYGDGDAWVMVTVYENGTPKNRSQEFLIKSAKDSKKLVITQVAPLPTINSNSVCSIYDFGGGDPVSTVPANGGIVLIAGRHIGMATIQCDLEDISYETNSSNYEYHYFKALIPSCPTAERRTIGFILTLTTESGELIQPYYIEQDGRNE